MATVILSVGLVSLAEIMAITVRMQMLGRNQTSAVRLAQDGLDRLMSLNFDAAPEIQLSASDTLASDVANYFDTPAPGYTRRWFVAPGPDANPNLRQVTVRIIPETVDRRTSTPVDLISVIRRW